MSESHEPRTPPPPAASARSVRPPDAHTLAEAAHGARPLPPLQALPAIPRASRNAWIERQLARAADARTLPRWGARWGLPEIARERAFAFVQASGGARLAVLLGDDPALAIELVAAGLSPSLVLPSPHALDPLARLVARAQTQAQAQLAERLREQERKRREAGWWAGPKPGAAPALPSAAALPALPAPPIVVAEPDRLPIATGSLEAIVAVDVLHLVSDWEHTAAQWARCLAPGGQLMLGSPSERDADAPGFLSALVRAMWPQAATGFPRSQDLTWVLATQGLHVQSASVLRLRMRFDDLEALGGDLDAVRGLCAEASESLRALYEIDEEGMTWRYQLVRAQKRTRP